MNPHKLTLMTVGGLLTAMLSGVMFAAPEAAKGAADKPAFPPLAPLGAVSDPVDNRMTPEKIALGKQLFWDNRLSGDGSMPCVSCHLPTLGWGDGGQISRGYPGTKHWRNSQTVLNSAFYNKYFWEGGVTSLEGQAPAAAEGAVAGNGDPSVMEMRLRHIPEYVTAFKQVFGSEWPRMNDAYRAIASFERTVISDANKVPFDRHANGDASALGEPQARGMQLFNGKAGCIQCHNGPLASNQKFYALGVPDLKDYQDDNLLQITHRWEIYQKGVPESEYRDGKTDEGYYYVTHNPKDKGKFRVPSLRELKYTGPFMHNGAFKTLPEVVAFYNAGGGKAGNKAELLKPLKLSEDEQKDLAAFLEALSMDEPLVMDAPTLPPYAPLPAVADKE
ncbi:cytochrome-c peroxidase [Thiothrix subterranea]|uniref:Cytochrome c peroxidase n=1 Tax=Thiothrix subterranea TaxID=2735563 RepID=A0AA51MI16_9GAMM|nr:cytochrome c peroxidase [Thiothrix subterranea]MDQ5768701.1 cytochrome c peroxidase [Thiothrix subterranea]WML84852.1 cytochrome c peroxidase [Thiothrix subterranea]